MNGFALSLRKSFRSGVAIVLGILPFHGKPSPHIPILPTRYGFIYLAMLAALLLGSINHNNNLGYLLTFLLGGMAAMSIFHTRRNISHVTVGSAKTKSVFAGQKATFILTIEASPISRHGVTFQFAGGEASTVNLNKGRIGTVQISLDTVQRGVLTPRTLIVSTTYPLGLFSARLFIPFSASCLVYPKPVPGPVISVPGPADKESEGDAGGGGVEDFSGLEVYKPGDQIHRISWKAYSRGQGLFTKTFEGLRGKSVYFNPDKIPGQDYELKLSRVCHMILMADAMRTPYGLQVGNRQIDLGTGEKHKRLCLAELALAKPGGRDDP